MELQSSIDKIWHFLGYLRLLESTGRDTLHYIGAPTYQTTPYDPDKAPAPLDVDPSYAKTAAIRFVKFASPPPSAVTAPDLPPSFDKIAPTLKTAGGSLILPAPVYAPGMDLVLPPKELLPPDAILRYWLGESQYHDIVAEQFNKLVDRDVVLDGLERLPAETLETAFAHVASKAGALQELIEIAETELPAHLSALFNDHPGNVIRISVDSDNALRPQLENGGADETAFEQVEAGRYVNGVAAEAETSDAQGEYVAAVAKLVNLNGSDDADDDETSEEHEGGAYANGAFAAAESWAPTAGKQQISTGDNSSVNVAVLQDYNDVFGSRIVLGDYYETNTIAQINVFAGRDAYEHLDGANVELVSDVVAANSFRNEATFVNEPGETYGDVESGYPFASDWRVHYTDGDLYDVTVVTQHNVLHDGDIHARPSSTEHYTLETGENGQLNVTQLLEYGTEYDLIIIEGDLITENVIIQVNVLEDEDLIVQHTSDGATHYYMGGGNHLENDAAIYSTGDGSFKPMSEEATEIAEIIGAQGGEIDGLVTIGLPGDGDDTFDVLYVKGDYYTYNLVMQTNTVSDGDYSYSEQHGDGAEHATDAGGNTLINAAVIIEQNSTSEYQYLAGEYHTEELLIQANIVEGEQDPQGVAGDLHEDVLAAIAGADDDDEAVNLKPEEITPDYGMGGGSTDVLGGVIA